MEDIHEKEKILFHFLKENQSEERDNVQVSDLVDEMISMSQAEADFVQMEIDKMEKLNQLCNLTLIINLLDPK